MAVITSIKQQKNKNRVNVYLDNKFGFGIDLDNFVILGLKLNQELSEKEIEEIVKKAEFQKSLDKLLKFAMIRARSEKEIRDYLKRKEIHSSLTDKLINRLTDLNLLDDVAFAKWWIEARQNFSPKSKKILKYELRNKGIDNNIIEDVFSITEIDEEKIILNLLAKKENKWKRYEEKVVKQKMFEYLARLGFDFNLIKTSVAKYLKTG